MELKPGEVCRHKDKCPYTGDREYVCFGIVANRKDFFSCFLVNDKGEFNFKPCIKEDITKKINPMGNILC